MHLPAKCSGDVVLFLGVGCVKVDEFRDPHQSEQGEVQPFFEGFYFERKALQHSVGGQEYFLPDEPHSFYQKGENGEPHGVHIA
ncbi:hypothetical protein ACQ86N_08985 [Puia sp. P3]|uniref:hypothetical protein n=1 Tax=Puia sp. P3 TaxID=3423952 RepID=UPI003D668C38